MSGFGYGYSYGLGSRSSANTAPAFTPASLFAGGKQADAACKDRPI